MKNARSFLTAVKPLTNAAPYPWLTIWSIRRMCSFVSISSLTISLVLSLLPSFTTSTSKSATHSLSISSTFLIVVAITASSLWAGRMTERLYVVRGDTPLRSPASLITSLVELFLVRLSFTTMEGGSLCSSCASNARILAFRFCSFLLDVELVKTHQRIPA